MAFTVYNEVHTENGAELDKVAVGADDYRFKEAGDYAVFVEFYTNDRVEDVFDAGRIVRIERT